MQTWFEAKAKYEKIDQDGRQRKVTENYLIDAVSVTDAEARLTHELQQQIHGEFQVDAMKKSNIIEIFNQENDGYWYRAKISIISIDEKAGKEKKVTNEFLIAAADFDQALKHLKDGLSYILVPFELTKLELSTIADVFPYFPKEEAITPTSKSLTTNN